MRCLKAMQQQKGFLITRTELPNIGKPSMGDREVGNGISARAYGVPKYCEMSNADCVKCVRGRRRGGNTSPPHQWPESD